MEGSSGLGDREISRELHMGEGNPHVERRVQSGPEVGMMVAIKQLKAQQSWAEKVLGERTER